MITLGDLFTTKELTITIRSEEDNSKTEELVTNYVFDIMYAVQDGLETLYLKSQGKAIYICSLVVLEIQKRMKNQLIKSERKIYLNSKFFNDTNRDFRNKKKSQDGKKTTAPKKDLIPHVLSFMDVKYNFLQ